jgi:hypothetical protein
MINFMGGGGSISFRDEAGFDEGIHIADGFNLMGLGKFEEAGDANFYEVGMVVGKEDGAATLGTNRLDIGHADARMVGTDLIFGISGQATAGKDFDFMPAGQELEQGGGFIVGGRVHAGMVANNGGGV